ncbi:MAG: hypothetical protein LBV45_06320 [Xanthomonadaceae bacterium]|nr:hypothetical protein [Xanthomonadaceae bacterium]
MLFLPLFFSAGAVCAQQTMTSDIERQMTPAEFTASGLDKLTPQELAALNAWLQGKVRQETAAAAAAARAETKKEIEDENRGFFHFGSREPIISIISGTFTGFAQGRRFQLENGQIWEQIEPASLAGVRQENPHVAIRPSMIGNAWYMQIRGYNTTAKVRRVE